MTEQQWLVYLLRCSDESLYCGITNDLEKRLVAHNSGTGALFLGNNTVIGNGVHVPTHFYKIVFDPNAMDAIAFLVPHRAISKGDLPRFIVSVDEVEERTGLDFNNLLDDAVEDDIEDDVESM